MNEETLLSIKEFSEFTGVNQSTLRYYDEIDLLPPASRGDNNYRYYAPVQIVKLNYINVLIDLGVPLSVIKDMDTNRTPQNIIELLSRQEAKLDERLHDLHAAYSNIHTYRKNIQAGLNAEHGIIRVEDFIETRLVLGHLNNFEKNTDSFYAEFIRFCQAADRRRINLRYPIGGYHDDMNAYLKTPGLPNRWFSLDPLGNTVRPAGKYLVAYVQGYYGQFGDMPKKMIEYAKEHDLVCKGPVYIVYLLDEISIVEPEQYLARVSVNVAQKKHTQRKMIK